MKTQTQTEKKAYQAPTLEKREQLVDIAEATPLGGGTTGEANG
jgi:hypothetical protein